MDKRVRKYVKIFCLSVQYPWYNKFIMSWTSMFKWATFREILLPSSDRYYFEILFYVCDMVVINFLFSNFCFHNFNYIDDLKINTSNVIDWHFADRSLFFGDLSFHFCPLKGARLESWKVRLSCSVPQRK